jgi:hypothetical protein
MKVFAVFLAVVILLIGFRLVVTALQTALTGRILVRQGIRSKWHPATNMSEAWKIAFRDGLMGILLIGLGIALIS